ncbi:calcium-binding protein [Lutimaribacter saemankumensis]|uniref:Hemolysin-type calcium-binding repeat-containing protein n=1 Tax=Lutimaribacter saemankumensis TaxID=490829 RepID=A0A1G8GUM4_9RHOB|nr:hypothetical protein [Lutimaribacter saemankumensis]SDH98052.1 Hemolysin-type calcium-binding repeat-containing protein [Lutimaribacter saemankumensis]
MIAAVLMAMGMLLGLGGLSIGEGETTLEGGDDPEALTGSDGDDSLSGGGGSDLLLGHGGDDSLSGGTGNDWLFGLEGDDLINGGPGNDVISGGYGSDTINGGGGDDFVESAGLLDDPALLQSAGTADDFGDLAFLYDFDQPGDTGDVIDLGPGDDTVVAGSDDTVTTGDGSDTIAMGDWHRGDAPVVITDFDPASDLITFAHDRAGPAPVFETFVNPLSGDAELRADGETFAVIRGAGADFQAVEVLRKSYAA